ncbi:hypothetical protein KAH81_10485 [bacterium]|nr:hypothetical protein [bacterium]
MEKGKHPGLLRRPPLFEKRGMGRGIDHSLGSFQAFIQRDVQIEPFLVTLSMIL